jgi:hypothetical protein
VNKSMETNEQRKLRSVARRYKRDGYRVTMPARGETVPTFLEGFTPDLIAESEHDRVVVEIKQSHALRGSNDLQEVAERVSRQPGWRFELVTVPSIEGVSRPTAERMEFIANRVRQAMNVGLTDMAYTYAWSFIEALLNELAVRHGLKARQMPIMHVGRELVVQGIISPEVLNALEQAYFIRNQVAHAASDFMPSAADVEELLALGQRVRTETFAVAAN